LKILACGLHIYKRPHVIPHKKDSISDDYPVQHSINLGKIHDVSLCRKTSCQNWSQTTGQLSLKITHTNFNHAGAVSQNETALFISARHWTNQSQPADQGVR
jgi:hypothetical protein